MGQSLRNYHQNKFYSFTSEAAELFAPECTFTDYVMEDYKRGFLPLLISLSYLSLQKEDEALVELRRGYDEKNAQLYNYGDDLILNVLMAALWDRYDTSISRPYWKKVTEIEKKRSSLSEFASLRIEEIDRAPYELKKWNIAGFGHLPQLEWKTQFFQHEKGPYAINSKVQFPASCYDKQNLVVPTKSWVDKIATRHAPGYHPLLYTKSLIRAPVGIGYGLVGITAGAAVGVGGCGLSVYTESAAPQVCGASMRAAGHIIKKSADLTEYTMGPDLRRWSRMPMLISLSTNPHGIVPTCNTQWVDFRKTITLLEN